MKYFPSARRDVYFRRGLIAAGAGAAALGAIASWVGYRARKAERVSPPSGKFVTVDDVRIHYLESGRGTPVVLLHGNMLRAEDFVSSGLFAQLAANHRVIAVDRPGYGFSDRPTGRVWSAQAQAGVLQRALAQIGVAQPVVVGHSWGTLVALELALLPEAAVRKLVLVSGYYFPSARADVALAAPPAIPVLGAILRHTVSALFARLTLNRTVQAMFAPQPVPAQFLPVLKREMLVRPKQIKAIAQDAVFMIPGAARLRSLYGDIRVPVAIFAGADDQVVNVDDHARRLNGQIAQSELTVLPGVGHMAHHAAPERIVAAVG